MLDFFKKINIENFKNSIVDVFKKMPFSVLILITFFVLSLIIIYSEDISYKTEIVYYKISISLIIMFLLNIGLYLYAEFHKIKGFLKWILQFFTIIFSLIFYFKLDDNLSNQENLIFIVIILVGLFSLIFLFPFYRKIFQRKLNIKDFYFFSYKFIKNSIIAIAIGLIVLILGFIALFSIFSLFNIYNFNELYSVWFSFSLFFLTPFLFLTELSFENLNRMIDEENKLFQFLIKYISLPAVIVYFIILYAYTIKVLLNFAELPQGQIVWLVIGFSIFGYLIYFISYLFEKKSKYISFFRKYFPYVVLPQLAMLFYAIFLRIGQHDWTINRYLVVAFGVWLLFLSFYYIFSKKKCLSVIFSSIVIIILLISSGPWSIFSFPEEQQKENLIENLKKANILQNEKIYPLPKNNMACEKLIAKIYNSIQYLCLIHNCNTLDDIFKNEIKKIEEEFKKEFKNEKVNISDWSLFFELTKKLNIRKIQDQVVNAPFLHFRLDRFEKYRAINLNNFDYLIYFSNHNFINPEKNKVLKNEYHIFFDLKKEILKIKKDEKIIETFSLSSIYYHLVNKNKLYTKHRRFLDSSKNIFNLDGEKINIKIKLFDISIKNPDYLKTITKEKRRELEIKSSLRINYIEGVILIKEK